MNKQRKEKMKKHLVYIGYIILITFSYFNRPLAQEIKIVSILNFEIKSDNIHIKLFAQELDVFLRNTLLGLGNIQLTGKKQLDHFQKKFTVKWKSLDNDLVIQKLGRRMAADIIFYGYIMFYKGNRLIRIHGRFLDVKTGRLISSVSMSDSYDYKEFIKIDFTQRVMANFSRKKDIKKQIITKKKDIIKKDKIPVKQNNNKITTSARSLTWNILFSYHWIIPGFQSNAIDNNYSLGGDVLIDLEDSIFSFGLSAKYFHNMDENIEIIAFSEFHLFTNKYQNPWQIYLRAGCGVASDSSSTGNFHAKLAFSSGVRFTAHLFIYDIRSGIYFTQNNQNIFSGGSIGFCF